MSSALWIPSVDSTQQFVLAEVTVNISPLDEKPYMTGNHLAEALVVENLRLNSRSGIGALVKGSPSMRFYAGAPLYSRVSYLIDAYAEIGENPRRGLDADEVKFMRDIAVMVMERSEMVKGRNGYGRGERMIWGWRHSLR